MAFFPLSEVAEKLQCSERHVRRLITGGRLNAVETVMNGHKMRLVEWYDGLEEQLSKPEKATCEEEAVPILPHASYVLEWKEMAKMGYLNQQNRPVTERTLDDYYYVLKVYFKQQPFICANGLYDVLKQYATEQYHYKKQIYWAVVSYAKFLVKKGILPEAELKGIQELKPTKRHTERRTVLEEDQVAKALEIIENNKKYNPYRRAVNKAILITFVETGMRNEELCSLELSNINFADRNIWFKGKGGKWRGIGITTKLYDTLQEYLAIRPSSDLPYFFLNESGHKFNRTSISNKIQRISVQLGVDITPHGLRRTFATVNARKGRSLETISKGLGHSNFRITQMYLRTKTEHVIEDMKNW